MALGRRLVGEAALWDCLLGSGLISRAGLSARGDPRSKGRAFLWLGPVALSAERRFSAIHFGLGHLAGLNQRCDACVVQLVAMFAHTVFQALCFKPPLVAEHAIIICTMARVTLFGLRGVDSPKNQTNCNTKNTARFIKPSL